MMVRNSLLIIGILSAVTISNSLELQDNNKSTLICVPDKIFAYDHNVCFCNKEGTEITCKRKIFSTLVPELHRLQLQNITSNCDPGKHFQQPCKDCICHKSGKYATCVHSDCPREEEAVLNTPENCTPGAVFSKKCNGCICGSNGKAACTKLDCKRMLKWEDDIKCVPNPSLMFGCNDCSCSSDGKSMFCNRMGCTPLSFYHEHVLNITMSCEPTSIFSHNCHKCFCGENGKYAMCSGQPCPPKFNFDMINETVQQCNPGVIFANDCNTCLCGTDGKGICTTFSCDTVYRFQYVEELFFTKPEE